MRIAAREGMVILDTAGSAPGRGGYLHPVALCLEKFTVAKIKEFRSLKSRIDRSERLRIAEAIKRRLDSETRLE